MGARGKGRPCVVGMSPARNGRHVTSKARYASQSVHNTLNTHQSWRHPGRQHRPSRRPGPCLQRVCSLVGETDMNYNHRNECSSCIQSRREGCLVWGLFPEEVALEPGSEGPLSWASLGNVCSDTCLCWVCVSVCTCRDWGSRAFPVREQQGF